MKTLRQLDVVDTGREEAFDRVTRLATEIFEVPIAVISFVGRDGHWCKSAVGINERALPPEDAFFTHTIQSEGVTVVENATQDERFMGHPWVTGSPQIRFYAGVPVTAPVGLHVGTLRVFDVDPRSPTAAKQHRLVDLAEIIGSELDRRRETDIHRNVEARVRQQRNLLQQAERLAGAWEIDLRSGEVTCSDTVYEIHEVAPGTPIEMDDVLQFYDPGPRERVRAAFRQCVEEREPYDVEVPITTAEGNRRWIRTVGAPVEEEDGEVVIVAGAFQDITERKHHERAHKKRREKVEALYDATTHLLTAETKTEVSDRLHEVLRDVFDYSLTAVDFVEEGYLVSDRVTVDEQYRMPDAKPLELGGDSIAAKTYETGSTVVVEEVQTRKGRIDYGDLQSAAGIPIGTHGVLLIAQVESRTFDVFDLRLNEVLGTYASMVLDRIEHEEKLVEAKEEAQRLSDLKSVFLATMSHEIRTPLTSILGFAEAIGDEITADEKGTVNRFARLIGKSGRRLMETLDGVLNFSRLEAGQMDLSPEPVDLVAGAKEVAEHLKPQAVDSDVEVQVDASHFVCGQVDSGGLQIVLRNLISNAIKYTNEEGHVWVRARTDGDAAVLEVEDTGIGMDPSRVEDLFDPFRQESEGESRTYQGTGLGLALVKQAVEKMGGTIDVQTEKGVGSRFTVRLPRCDEEELES